MSHVMVFTYTYYRIISGDSLTFHRNNIFTTWDRNGGEVCAELFHGAWWYNGCMQANLNGPYRKKGVSFALGAGIVWYHWKKWYESYKTSTMKMRPANFGSGGKFVLCNALVNSSHITREQVTHRDRHIYILSVALTGQSVVHRSLEKCHPTTCFVRSMSLECRFGLCSILSHTHIPRHIHCKEVYTLMKSRRSEQ